MLAIVASQPSKKVSISKADLDGFVATHRLLVHIVTHPVTKAQHVILQAEEGKPKPRIIMPRRKNGKDLLRGVASSAIANVLLKR